MIKAVVFDLDGVLIQEHCHASDLFERKCGIPHEEFYGILKKNKFLERTKDQGPTFNLFHDLLKKYNVKITEEKFWDLWLTNFRVNQDVVDFALSLKNEGKKIGILSDNLVERAEYFKKNLEWIKKFDCVLFSCDYSVTKNNPKFFEILVRKLRMKPQEIFFTDDTEKNVYVAKSVGLQGMKFKDLESLKKTLSFNSEK